MASYPDKALLIAMSFQENLVVWKYNDAEYQPAGDLHVSGELSSMEIYYLRPLYSLIFFVSGRT